MPSSSPSDNVPEPSDEIPLCECNPQMRAKERESKRDSNPARRFFNCRNSLFPDRPKCNFFRWKDHALSTHYKNTILTMKKNLAEIDAVCNSLEAGHLLNNLLRERSKREIDNNIATKKISELQALYDLAATEKASLEEEKIVLLAKIEEMEVLVGKLKSKNKNMCRFVMVLVLVIVWMVVVR